MSLPLSTRSELKKQAGFQQLVLANFSDSLVITDLHFIVQYWNPVAEQQYGITAAKAIGSHLCQLVPYATLHLKGITEHLHHHQVWEGEVSWQNGEGQSVYLLQTVKLAVNEKGEEAGMLITGKDISHKKREEQALLQSEQFYRTLIADSLDTIILMNEEGRVIFVTPSVTGLLGYDINEVLGTNGFTYIHPDDVQYSLTSFEKEATANSDEKFIVIRLLKKDGDWLWCMARGHNLLKIPAVQAIVMYVHDDTPRKQVTDALKESEERFRNLIRDLRIGVLLQDAKGNTLMTNNGMKKMFGLGEEQVLGEKIWDLYSDVIHEDGSIFLLKERPTVKAIETRRLVQDVVMGVWHKGRKERIWIMINADPILDAEGNLLNIVCSFTDITERKKLEKKSFSEKMAYQRHIAQATIDGQEKERLEMGTELHDNIGQQLTTIKLYLELAKTTANPETKEMVDMSLKGISDAINEVRSISHSLVPPTLKDLGFIESVNDLVDSLHAVQPINIELDYFEFDEDLLPENKKLAMFRIIQEQLNNITKHAGAENVWITLSSCADHAMLKIQDDGTGFDLARIRRGLGLSNIINRAELFGGRVEITTSPGKGCKINVWIPHTLTSVVF